MQDLYVPYPLVRFSYFSKAVGKFVTKREMFYKHFRFNVLRVRYPFINYVKRIYTIYNLPFLKTFFYTLNKHNMTYFIRFIKTFFLKNHVSLDRLFFQLKLILIFLVFMIMLLRVNKNKFMAGFSFSSRGYGSFFTNTIIRRFFVLWGYSPAQRGVYFLYLSKMFGIFFRYFVSWEVDFKNILISNDEVTAKFLSRYLAIKLQYNHTIRELMRPIRRELSRLSIGTEARGFVWGGYLVK